MHNRKEIRKTLKSVLENNAQLDVKSVYLSRPNPLLLSELPVCLVYFTDEPAEVFRGSNNFPDSYKRSLQINIDIVCDVNDNADDYLDDQLTKVELALLDDTTLNNKCLGLKLSNTKPYTIDTGSDKTFWATSSSWVIPYETDTYLDSKNPLFTEFNVKINRDDYNEDTIDPTLSEAEKNF